VVLVAALQTVQLVVRADLLALALLAVTVASQTDRPDNPTNHSPVVPVELDRAAAQVAVAEEVVSVVPVVRADLLEAMARPALDMVLVAVAEETAAKVAMVI
jgi:hypothetical protein